MLDQQAATDLQPLHSGNAEQKAIKELSKLAKGSERIILHIKTVFPFDFFPDEIIVDETKVSIHTKYFFYTKEIRSIEYGDIFNVVVHHGLLFATIEIVDRFFAQDPLTVGYLKKADALLARRIIQGMIIAKKQNIEIQALSVEELWQKLDVIGRSR